MRAPKLSNFFPFSWRDLLITISILFIAVALCMPLKQEIPSDGFASPIFVLAVLFISHLTNGYLFGVIAAVAGVVCVNFLFTYPYWKVDFSMAGYPITSLSFLAVSIITSTLTTQVHKQTQLRAEHEKEKMWSNLLRSVSHDIRTPLTSIIGSTSAMLENPKLSSNEQNELLCNIRDESQWLIQVVENLLSITRIGDEQSPCVTTTPEAAEEVLSEAVQKFHRRFPNISVSVEVPDELLIVPMDPILIEQVLSNLLENAVIHGKTTSHIHLSVQKESNIARFSVTDNGQGISDEVMPNLFNGTFKHRRAPSGDGKRNMGLGLSVCLAVVRAHGGTMTAQNLASGAEFIFCLPLNKETPP